MAHYPKVIEKKKKNMANDLNHRQTNKVLLQGDLVVEQVFSSDFYLGIVVIFQGPLWGSSECVEGNHVPIGITDSSFTDRISLVLATNQVSFSNDELTLEGNDHTLSMHIVVKCKGMIVARVLIDNGSTLNVCPMATLEHLKLDLSLI